MNMGELLLNHYEHFLGNYIGADVYNNGQQEVQILGFPKAIENSMVFATFGVSKHSDMINNQCEIILAVDENYDECAEIFANSVFYILSNRMEFGKGILIEGAGNIVDDFVEKYHKSALYFYYLKSLHLYMIYVAYICVSLFPQKKQSILRNTEARNLKIFWKKVKLM